jgi:(p)ppGpp synthase/HD superfamily hydrolase
VPYASHPVRVAGLVLEHGGDATQVAVGLLHDVIEDCGVADAELERRFSAEVARAVRALSDVLEGDTPKQKAPWRERKTRFVSRIAEIDARARLVAACDKLDNLSAIVADLETEGLATLERFSGSPRQIRWYYEEVIRALGRDLPPRLRAELDDRLDMLRRFVPEASPEP